MINLFPASQIFISIPVSLVIALITGWFSTKIARRFNLMDVPGSAPHKKHKNPTPLAGGLTLIISVFVVMTIFNLWSNHDITFMVLSGIVIFAFGVWDDAKGLSAPVKLGGQILATLILLLSGISIKFFESDTFFFGNSGPVYFAIDRLLTILWVIGITNAFNLVDSMDGLSVGLSAWAFGFFMLATIDSQQPDLSLISAILLGVCLALYFYNSSPSLFFLGDSGAQLLGFFLSVIAILYSPNASEQTSSWFVPILLLGVPIFDTALVFFSRVRKKQPFYLGSLDHTYHRLVALGLPSGRAVLTMHLTALFLECLAFIAASLPPLPANIIFVSCLISGVVCMILIDNHKGKEEEKT